MMRPLSGRLLKIVLALGCAAALAVGWIVLRSPDPAYSAYEMVFNRSFHRYDAIIQKVARQQGIDPMLIKAVIWRESRFRPGKVGQDGERGLMQLTEGAAGEWAKSEKIAHFTPDDLFEPETNIQAGSWLLSRALRRYQDRDNPLPFALAEYNAGRSRVLRWVGDARTQQKNGADNAVSGRDLQDNIAIPSTKAYVQTVQDRLRFYQQRGRL